MSLAIDLSSLRDRRTQRRILVVTLAGALLGGAYGLLAPKWFRAAVTLVPSRPPRSSGFSSLLGSDLGGLAASLDTAGGADVQRIAAVLQSNAVTDAVIKRHDLRKRYDQSTQEGAREAVWDHCGVGVAPKPALVTMSCEDKDPEFVKVLLDSFAEHANQVFGTVGNGSAGEEVRFLERHVAVLRDQADEAALRVREFQEKHQLVDIESQSRALVSSAAELHRQRIEKQAELEYAREFSSEDEPTVRQLRSQKEAVERALRGVEDSVPSHREAGPGATSGASGVRPGMFPPALKVPRLRAEFEKLYRDRKVAETSLVFALERLESARAALAREASTFQVLDPATVPTRKSRPRGTLVVVQLASLCFFGATAFELFRANRKVRAPLPKSAP